MERRYHATTQNRFYPDMSNVNKNITVEAKLISPLTYLEWVRADDSNLVTSCCQGLHDGLESQLITDGRREEGSQDASSLGAAHCIQQQ
jgi:hypothetical protein